MQSNHYPLAMFTGLKRSVPGAFESGSLRGIWLMQIWRPHMELHATSFTALGQLKKGMKAPSRSTRSFLRSVADGDQTRKQVIWSLFQDWDLDDDGCIDYEELEKVISGVKAMHDNKFIRFCPPTSGLRVVGIGEVRLDISRVFECLSGVMAAGKWIGLACIGGSTSPQACPLLPERSPVSNPPC